MLAHTAASGRAGLHRHRLQFRFHHACGPFVPPDAFVSLRDDRAAEHVQLDAVLQRRHLLRSLPHLGRFLVHRRLAFFAVFAKDDDAIVFLIAQDEEIAQPT